MQPLTTRKIAAASGLASATRIACSNSTPRIPTGIVATMISHASRSVERLDPPLAERREEAPDQLDPVAPEVDQQPDGAADVQHHDERQPRRLGLRLPCDDVVPAEQVRERSRCGRGSRPGTAR